MAHLGLRHTGDHMINITKTINDNIAILLIILKPECNFLHGYFRCLLRIETVDIKVKVKNDERHPHIQERPDHPGIILQPLEYKTPYLPIPNKINEDLFRTRRQTW